ncbi:unnamed protein product, partial [Linum tenue]
FNIFHPLAVVSATLFPTLVFGISALLRDWVLSSTFVVLGMARAMNKRAKLRSRPALISTDTEIENRSRVLKTEAPSSNGEGSGSTPPLRPELTEEGAGHETGQGGTSKGHVGRFRTQERKIGS